MHNTSLKTPALSALYNDKVANVCAAAQICPPATFTVFYFSHYDNFQHFTIDNIQHDILQSLIKSCQLDALLNFF